MICLNCKQRYEDPLGQAERFGRRFRFVLRNEIPHHDSLGIDERSIGFMPYHPYREIYKILLIAKDRQEILQKEVNWKVDEQTKKILQLPLKIAAVVAQTWEIQGDDAVLDNSEAITRIRDMLDDIDADLIEKALRKKKKKKRLP